jgi:hypothetical protein
MFGCGNVANKKTKRVLSGEQLAKSIAEKVFGWKSVRKHNGELVGKRQDKAGRWRKARVPDYVNDPRLAYAIDERMKQLGRSERYLKELSRIIKATNLPSEWATAEHRSRAAINVIGKTRRAGKLKPSRGAN